MWLSWYCGRKGECIWYGRFKMSSIGNVAFKVCHTDFYSLNLKKKTTKLISDDSTTCSCFASLPVFTIVLADVTQLMFYRRSSKTFDGPLCTSKSQCWSIPVLIWSTIVSYIQTVQKQALKRTTGSSILELSISRGQVGKKKPWGIACVCLFAAYGGLWWSSQLASVVESAQ